MSTAGLSEGGTSDPADDAVARRIEPAQQSATQRSGAEVADRITTWVLIVGMAIFSALASFVAPVFAMAADNPDTNMTWVRVFIGIVMFGPWLLTIGTAILCIHRHRRGKFAFFVPLAVLAASPLLLLALSGVSSQF
ncbi:hypothetical protein [Pseudoclavibacter helvolus]|uniref:Uncharacterized protein n=1 Tax=Pseudoclavibacter helvolus TaxID=255205 RepID=A0A7W4YH34_9MICO|nr:hypothetical protein [Pseudoclavibacter helvolus]MBB2958565.1 hypothetical protein [Pseudoclavibacter helvolus]